jgi:hypothetical protein
MQGLVAPAVYDSSELKPAGLRALQRAVAPAGAEGVAYVTTPQELVDALSAGVRHIEITEHLDLTTLRNSFSYSGQDIMLNVSMHTWSIRVRSSPCYDTHVEPFRNRTVPCTAMDADRDPDSRTVIQLSNLHLCVAKAPNTFWVVFPSISLLVTLSTPAPPHSKVQYA